MFIVEFITGVIVFFCWSVVVTRGDNFPSLITTNATLAIIIDKEYLAEDFEKVKAAIDAYLAYTRREILKHGGVNVLYYSWTAINIKRDITAMLSIASCSDTWRLFKAAEEENLLHMAISESDCPRLPINQAITVPMIDRGQELPQLLLDLRTVKAYDWKSAVILYDNTLSRDLVTRVVKSLTFDSANVFVRPAAVSLINLEINKTSPDIRLSLREKLEPISIKTVGRNFMAIVGIELVESLMDYAKTLKLVNTKSQWLYVISNTDQNTRNINRFRRLLKDGDNVAFLYNTTVINGECTGGVICHTEEILQSFGKALDNAIQDEFEIASQVSDEEWEAIRPTKFERRNFLLNNVRTSLLNYGKCDNCTSWSMKTGDTWGREFQKSYDNNQHSNSSALLINSGNWRPSDGPSMSDELFPHISHGFRKITLPVISFHNPPWQILKYNSTGAVTEYSGLIFDVLKELANNLNFTFTVQVLEMDNESSNAMLTGNSTKSLEMGNRVTNVIPELATLLVKNKSMAFGACAFTITERGRHVVNFTSPISTQWYTFLVARPRELSRALLFLSPFTKGTWLCLSGAIVSMGPILYYIHRLSPSYEYKGIRKRGGLSSIQNCIWYMYGALLQQGGMYLPEADSARIIVGAWWLVVLVIATTYCGNLVAFLTFPKIDIPITTVEDLIEHKETVKWSMNNGSYLETQLQIATERKYRILYQKRANTIKDKDLIQQIEDGKHVYLDWKIKLQYIMKNQFLETDRCDLALGVDDFYPEQLAMIVSQDNPYLEIINDEIKKLHQVGLIEKWLRDYLPKKDRCWKNRHIVEVNNHTVNMDDMQGSFFILFLGFVLSSFIVLSERLWYKYLVKRKEKAIQPFTK